MHGRAEPGSIAKRVHDDAVHFDVHWSPLSLVDRYEIAARVPAVAGVYELYAELATRLHKFAVEGAWYGGLRAAIRAGTDGDVVTDPERRALLARWRCRYRFCAVDARDDLFDLLHALRSRDPSGVAAASGRYASVSVSERGELRVY